jgi:hypothetical protein
VLGLVGETVYHRGREERLGGIVKAGRKLGAESRFTPGHMHTIGRRELTPRGFRSNSGGSDTLLRVSATKFNIN